MRWAVVVILLVYLATSSHVQADDDESDVTTAKAIKPETPPLADASETKIDKRASKKHIAGKPGKATKPVAQAGKISKKDSDASKKKGDKKTDKKKEDSDSIKDEDNSAKGEDDQSDSQSAAESKAKAGEDGDSKPAKGSQLKLTTKCGAEDKCGPDGMKCKFDGKYPICQLPSGCFNCRGLETCDINKARCVCGSRECGSDEICVEVENKLQCRNMFNVNDYSDAGRSSAMLKDSSTNLGASYGKSCSSMLCKNVSPYALCIRNPLGADCVCGYGSDGRFPQCCPPFKPCKGQKKPCMHGSNKVTGECLPPHAKCNKDGKNCECSYSGVYPFCNEPVFCKGCQKNEFCDTKNKKCMCGDQECGPFQVCDSTGATPECKCAVGEKGDKKEGDCAAKSSCNDAVCFRKSPYGRCTFTDGVLGCACKPFSEGSFPDCCPQFAKCSEKDTGCRYGGEFPDCKPPPWVVCPAKDGKTQEPLCHCKIDGPFPICELPKECKCSRLERCVQQNGNGKFYCQCGEEDTGKPCSSEKGKICVYDRNTGKSKCITPKTCSELGDCKLLDEMSECKEDDKGARCVCREGVAGVFPLCGVVPPKDECPKGEEMKNGECVCRNGRPRGEDGKCQEDDPTPPEECPTGQKLKGKKCVCLDGSEPKGGKCPTSKCPQGQKLADGECVCEDGSSPVNGECPTKPCPPGQKLVGKKCVCEDGSSPVNGECPTKPCPPGQKLVGKKCVCEDGRPPVKGGCRETGGPCDDIYCGFYATCSVGDDGKPVCKCNNKGDKHPMCKAPSSCKNVYCGPNAYCDALSEEEMAAIRPLAGRPMPCRCLNGADYPDCDLPDSEECSPVCKGEKEKCAKIRKKGGECICGVYQSPSRIFQSPVVPQCPLDPCTLEQIQLCRDRGAACWAVGNTTFQSSRADSMEVLVTVTDPSATDISRKALLEALGAYPVCFCFHGTNPDKTCKVAPPCKCDPGFGCVVSPDKFISTCKCVSQSCKNGGCDEKQLKECGPNSRCVALPGGQTKCSCPFGGTPPNCNAETEFSTVAPICNMDKAEECGQRGGHLECDGDPENPRCVCDFPKINTPPDCKAVGCKEQNPCPKDMECRVIGVKTTVCLCRKPTGCGPEPPQACMPNPCGPNSFCNFDQAKGAYYCSCLRGFKGKPPRCTTPDDPCLGQCESTDAGGSYGKYAICTVDPKTQRPVCTCKHGGTYPYCPPCTGQCEDAVKNNCHYLTQFYENLECHCLFSEAPRGPPGTPPRCWYHCAEEWIGDNCKRVPKASRKCYHHIENLQQYCVCELGCGVYPNCKVPTKELMKTECTGNVNRERWLRAYHGISNPKPMRKEDNPWHFWQSDRDNPKYHNTYPGKTDE